MKIIIPTKPSRPVRFNLSDIWVVLRDSFRIMRAMRKPFPGKFPWASSISHCQLKDAVNDPLRFFVVDREGGMSEQGVRLRQSTKLKKYFGGRVIINPEILAASEGTARAREGCMSFPDEKIRKVARQEWVIARYWTFSGRKTKKLFLYRASLLQHELDHFDLVNIEDKWRHKKR